MRYDPHVAPLASHWLALEEGARIALAEQSHRGDALDASRLLAHAAIHAAVETQIAMEVPSVVNALRRLRGDGLDRHDAIHAIGSVLVGTLGSALRGDPTASDPSADYFAALDQLSAASWSREYGEAPGAG
jgi:hypothetical protein